MKRTFGLAAALGLLIGATQAQGQSFVFDFEDSTDQGFGTGFGNDASATFSIVNIGGSLRMAVPSTPAFQEAGREGGSGPFLAAMNAAAASASASTISYDWYVDTASFVGASFLQVGTYINSGSGAYSQDFPGSGKDVELNGTQLSSGQVFFGTVTETLTQKYGDPLAAGHMGQTFQRLGLIMNGDGSGVTVYFDNIAITAVPEPASLALLGLAAPALWMMFGRRSTHR